MNGNELEKIVLDAREVFNNLDRELLNITTLYQCEGDDLLNFYMETMLKVKDKAILWNKVLTQLHNKAKRSNLDCTSVIKGMKSFRNLIRSLSMLITLKVLVCEA